MLPSTSTATSYAELAFGLAESGFQDWTALQKALEQRVRDDLVRGTTTTTRAERQLLDGLHLRERYLRIPFYQQAETRGPLWWIMLKGSGEKAEAGPESRFLP